MPDELLELLELAVLTVPAELLELSTLSESSEELSVLVELLMLAELAAFEDDGMATVVAEFIINTRKGKAAFAELAAPVESAEFAECLAAGIGNLRFVESIFVYIIT